MKSTEGTEHNASTQTEEKHSKKKIIVCKNVQKSGKVLNLATYMLMTSGCWWQFSGFGDRISILVTSFGCWCPTLILKDTEYWWQNRPKPSPTSQSRREYISSPTSVANIDVAVWYDKYEMIHMIWYGPYYFLNLA